MAKDFKGKEDAELFKKIKSEYYMYYAVVEAYESMRDVIYGLLEDESDKRYEFLYPFSIRLYPTSLIHFEPITDWLSTNNIRLLFSQFI